MPEMNSTPRTRPARARSREEDSRRARRATVAGLVVNILLTGFKFAAGILGHSQAVVADAVHSLSDMATDVMILVGIRYWSRPADADHPYGHRRIETVVTGLIGFSLAAVGVGLGYNALATMPDEHGSPPEWVAFAAAAAAVVVKEIVYRWTVAVGRRIRSTAVIANAWHHRSDALSSVPTALAVLGARLVPEWAFLDHVGAVVVAVFILHAAWRIVFPAMGQLIDAGAPREVIEKIEKISRSTPGVRGVHAIRTRYLGPALMVDLRVHVAPEMTVLEGHGVAEDVRRRLVEDEGGSIIDVVVHVEPYEEDAPAGAPRHE